jgi:hypothetical protein
MNESKPVEWKSFTEAEQNELIDLMNELPAQFYQDRSADWQTTILRMAEIVRIAQERSEQK